MKLILVNQRYGHTRTIVIRGWMKGLLSVCLLGAPLALACLGYELAVADSSPNAVHSQNRVAADEFIQSHENACADCLAYVLFDDNIEGAGNYPCYADLCSAALLAVQPEAAAVLPAQHQESPSAPQAVYSHGRLIDPARYACVTRHQDCSGRNRFS